MTRRKALIRRQFWPLAPYLATIARRFSGQEDRNLSPPNCSPNFGRRSPKIRRRWPRRGREAVKLAQPPRVSESSQNGPEKAGALPFRLQV